ncbi:hypothetical protein PQR08_01130 [Caballeronia jiangsuensis]|uniref:Secreted protein n=1 Tax=Caballeronia jiangsuensis TaxID=1458357 RepID=A0ABW9CCG6_9BURK|nr:hypothetical protein [Caballeronia sp. GaOx3]
MKNSRYLVLIRILGVGWVRDSVEVTCIIKTYNHPSETSKPNKSCEDLHMIEERSFVSEGNDAQSGSRILR